jgi:hypothetical protein
MGMEVLKKIASCGVREITLPTFIVDGVWLLDVFPFQSVVEQVMVTKVTSSPLTGMIQGRKLNTSAQALCVLFYHC